MDGDDIVAVASSSMRETTRGNSHGGRNPAPAGNGKKSPRRAVTTNACTSTRSAHTHQIFSWPFFDLRSLTRELHTVHPPSYRYLSSQFSG